MSKSKNIYGITRKERRAYRDIARKECDSNKGFQEWWWGLHHYTKERYARYKYTISELYQQMQLSDKIKLAWKVGHKDRPLNKTHNPYRLDSREWLAWYMGFDGHGMNIAWIMRDESLTD